MKKRGILNAQLSGYIAALGHKDTFMIGDAGMPIPKGVPIVDLALCGNVPTFIQTMDAVLAVPSRYNRAYSSGVSIARAFKAH
jgi:D-ribose pyranase